jgi:hypothetical protein
MFVVVCSFVCPFVQGHVQLVDFGLSKLMDAGRCETNQQQKETEKEEEGRTEEEEEEEEGTEEEEGGEGELRMETPSFAQTG